MFGAGLDVLGVAGAILNKLKSLKDLKTGHAAEVIKYEVWLARLAAKGLSGNVAEFCRDFVKGLASFSLLDTAFSPTDFTKAKVFLPLSMKMIDGATIANASIQIGHKYNYGSLYVYGAAW